MSLQCCACKNLVPFSAFSQNQLRKVGPRCPGCIKQGQSAALNSPRKARKVAQCTSCNSWRLKEDFLNPLDNEQQGNGCIKLPGPCSRQCEERIQGRLATERAAEEEAANEAKRRTHGCKVKHVQKTYGHLCEIPIQAYAEAGVADSWEDYVTKEDVERASDAWDARGIAHDIDTQWGSMPWGGAYKDSNHYWGPGEYDFY